MNGMSRLNLDILQEASILFQKVLVIESFQAGTGLFCVEFL